MKMENKLPARVYYQNPSSTIQIPFCMSWFALAPNKIKCGNNMLLVNLIYWMVHAAEKCSSGNRCSTKSTDNTTHCFSWRMIALGLMKIVSHMTRDCFWKVTLGTYWTPSWFYPYCPCSFIGFYKNFYLKSVAYNFCLFVYFTGMQVRTVACGRTLQM